MKTKYVVHYSHQRFQDWLKQHRIAGTLDLDYRYMYVGRPEILRGLKSRDDVIVVDMPSWWSSGQMQELRQNLRVLELIS